MGDIKTVVLAYRRVPGDLSSGHIVLTDKEDSEVLRSFEGLDFKVMMREFAVELNARPDAAGAIQRTDRPGLAQIPLSQDEVDLFRRDPAEAIRQRTIPPQRIVIGIDKAAGPDRTVAQVVDTAQKTVLEAGYDSLVQFFGDTVFARARKNDAMEEVECHVCGAWAPLHRSTTYNVIDSYSCAECKTSLPIADYSGAGWAGVYVTSLLGLEAQMFFLPRRWNTHGNWITREELTKLYAEYNKEKSV